MRTALLLLAVLLSATACSKEAADKAGVTPNALTTSKPEAVATSTQPAAPSTRAPAY